MSGKVEKTLPFWVVGLGFLFFGFFFFNFHEGSSRDIRIEIEPEEESQGPGQPHLPIPTTAWALLPPPRTHPTLPQTRGPQPPPCLALWPIATAPDPTFHTVKPSASCSPGLARPSPPAFLSLWSWGAQYFVPKILRKQAPQSPLSSRRELCRNQSPPCCPIRWPSPCGALQATLGIQLMGMGN